MGGGGEQGSQEEHGGHRVAGPRVLMKGKEAKAALCWSADEDGLGEEAVGAPTNCPHCCVLDCVERCRGGDVGELAKVQEGGGGISGGGEAAAHCGEGESMQGQEAQAGPLQPLFPGGEGERGGWLGGGGDESWIRPEGGPGVGLGGAGGEQRGGGRGRLRDAKRTHVLDHRDTCDAGGAVCGRHVATEKDSLRLLSVDDLASRAAEAVESVGEGGDGSRREVAHVDPGVVCVVGGDISDPGDSNPEEGLCSEVGGEGLCDKEVEEGRERAALADACVPLEKARLNAVGVDRGERVVQDDHGPGDHAVVI